MVVGMKKIPYPTVGEVIDVQIAFSQITFWLRVLPCSLEIDQAIRVIEKELDHQENPHSAS